MGTRIITHMATTKLVVCVALLSAVALSAPSADETETLVQSMSMSKIGSSVDSLKHQFHQLEVQLKSGAKATPAVLKVIDEMISMVEDEIEPGIEDAHAGDQDLINALHTLITDFNTEQQGKEDLLQSTAEAIRKDIRTYNGVAVDWDEAGKAYTASIKKYETTVKDKTDTCCDKQQAAVVGIEYTPAYASCDYTAADADKCTAKAIAQVDAAVKSDFAAGLKRYTDLVKGCSTMTTNVANDKADMDKKNRHCDDTEADALARYKDVTGRKAQFDQDWKDASDEYDSGIAKLESNYTKTSARVKDDAADRANEWTSTQEIKCMLRGYQAGGSFDSAQMEICKGKISVAHLQMTYPAIPARVVWDLDPFPPVTDYKPFEVVCHQEEAADESADQKCSIVPTPAEPKCDKDAKDDGPKWELSPAGAKWAGQDAEPAKPANPDKCNGVVVPATKGDNGVWFTWASPCSGGCSKATPQCGWGICSKEDWKGLPSAQMKKDKPCSSKIFDNKWGHCDPSNKFVRVEDGSYNELVFCYNGK